MRPPLVAAVVVAALAHAPVASSAPAPARLHVETEAFHHSSSVVGGKRLDFSGVELRWKGVRGDWSFRVGVPLLTVSGAAGLAMLGPYVTRVRSHGGSGSALADGAGQGVHGVLAPSDGATARPTALRRTGIGDLRMDVARWLTRPKPAGRLSARGGLKLPTAHASDGLGTGKADAWVGFGWRREGWVVDLEAVAEWVHLGDTTTFDLRDGPAGEITLDWPRNRGGLRAGLEAAVSPVGGEDPRLRAIAGAYGAMSRRVSWSAEAAAGLTDSAPDIGLALTVGF